MIMVHNGHVRMYTTEITSPKSLTKLNVFATLEFSGPKENMRPYFITLANLELDELSHRYLSLTLIYYDQHTVLNDCASDTR